MSTNNYRVKIIRGDFEFEAQGDKTFVMEMLNRFGEKGSKTAEKKHKGSSKGKDLATVSGIADAKAISVGEFIRQIGVKRHTHMVLAFGYYLEKFAGVDAFTPADINTCYYDSKMESSNTSQMIIQNIKAGRIMEAKKGKGKKKSYVLTRTGEEYIKSKLSKEA